MIDIGIMILSGIVAIIVLWYLFFNYMTKNIDARIIARNGGYVIQIKGRIKWNDICDRYGNSITFKTKIDAAEVLESANKQARN